MKKVNWFTKFNKWFDLNLGWFFVNGFKQEEWVEYLEEKYKRKNLLKCNKKS